MFSIFWFFSFQNYGITLAKQLGTKKPGTKFGIGLSEEQYIAFNAEQIAQLYALFEETHKPIDPENPLGEHPMVQPRKDS